MKYRVLEGIKLKTSKSEIELHPGQVVVLNNDVAISLISKGRINPIGKVICKIHSRLLDDYLWIVATGKGLRELVTEGIQDVIYTQEEVSRMIDEDVSKEGLAAIHKVKKAFSGATVEDIENKQKKI